MRSVSKRIHINEKQPKKGGLRKQSSHTTSKYQEVKLRYSTAGYLESNTVSQKKLQHLSKSEGFSSGKTAKRTHSNKCQLKKTPKRAVTSSDQKRSGTKQRVTSSNKKRSVTQQRVTSLAQKRCITKQRVTSSAQEKSIIKQRVTSSAQKKYVAKQKVTSSVLKRSIAKQTVSSSALKRSVAKQRATSSTEKRAVAKQRVTSSAQKRSVAKTDSSQSVVTAPFGVSLKTASVVLKRSPHLDKYCRRVIVKAGSCRTNRKNGLAIKRKKMNLEAGQRYTGEAPAESNGVMTGPKSSPKKLKGTLSVKFKSWNFQKEGSNSKEAFGSIDKDVAQGAVIGQKTFPKQVVISQDNQMLQKCDSCLLYIPVESFEQHRKKDCEALNIAGGKDYICSECLACYASQKFLARHKRECPKRSQSLSMQSGHQKSWGQGGVEGMYSVVWKCHCKLNFASAEELAKHRESCVSAQQYTATCPICNIRVMGGSRTLRYHMTQNHASLFMPEETSSSSVLGGLEGTSPVGVITTQTTNLTDLVRRLSREHAGANIRIVSVNTDRYKGQQKDVASDGPSNGRGQQGIVIEQDKPAFIDQRNSPPNKTSSEVQEHCVVGLDSNKKHSWQENEVELVEEKFDPAVVAIEYNETRAVNTEKASATDVGGTVTDVVEHGTTTNGHAKESNKDDLKNLLVKAKALTKELEEKLATGSETDKTEKSDEETMVMKRSPRKRKPVVNMENDAPSPKKKVAKSPAKSNVTVKQEVTDQRPVKTKRRFSQVTCLDCQQVFNDYVELGRHKRTDCPVVISQHLSPDGNFTEKVDLFGKDQKAKQQKLDVAECYYCTLCSSKFKLRSQVYEHMRFEHKNKGLNHYLNYHCPYCPRVFQTTKQRHLHKLERHADIKIAPEDDFTVKETEVCSVCYQVVPKWDKDKHFATNCKKNATETESDTFCQLCGLLLDTQEALKQHRQVEHLNAIHFRCGLCSRTFGHAVELRCHKVSHHTKNPRWEQNYTAVKMQESKMSPGTKNIKIHISPCVEEVKSPAAKPREPSPTKTHPREEQKQVTFAAETSEVSAGSKGTSAKSKSIRMPTDGSPLSLTPEQMKSLSQGQPIKLVIPKDADMRNLSFTVPGEDGKPKKYSLLPKSLSDTPGQKGRAHNKEELSKLGASLGVQAPAEAERHGSPQRELAAALGLRPRGNPEPARTQHRPTRLRSGRTIDKKVGVMAGKDKKPAAVVINTRAKLSLRPSTRGKRVVVTAERKKTKNEDSSSKKVVKGKDSGEESGIKKKGELKTDTAGRRGRTPPTKKETKNENKSSIDKESQKMVSRQDRMVKRTSKEDVKQLAPVQVLKPIGKDRVLCMRCNSILGSMEEVACHHCKTAK